MPLRTALLALLACAACGGTDATSPDAAAPDAPTLDAPAVDAPAPDAGAQLGCLGAPPATTAPDPIEIGGTVYASVAYQVSPVAGANVELRARADNTVIATAMTAADGTFTMSAPTGGHPLDAWFAVASAGSVPTRAYASDPLVGFEHAFLLVASAGEIATWYADAGAATFTPAARTVITSVKDCDNDSPGGVTMAIAPATRTTYYDTALQRWNPALADAPNGFVLATDAAASPTLTPSIGATALPARVLAPAPGVLTLLVATPRAAP